MKRCLDDCNACERTREKEVEVELARKHLENQPLKRKIEFLDKAQEYRCCPDVTKARRIRQPSQTALSCSFAQARISELR